MKAFTRKPFRPDPNFRSHLTGSWESMEAPKKKVAISTPPPPANFPSAEEFSIAHTQEKIAVLRAMRKKYLQKGLVVT